MTPQAKSELPPPLDFQPVCIYETDEVKASFGNQSAKRFDILHQVHDHRRQGDEPSKRQGGGRHLPGTSRTRGGTVSAGPHQSLLSSRSSRLSRGEEGRKDSGPGQLAAGPMQKLSWTEAVQSVARSKVTIYLTKLSFIIELFI